MAAQHRHQGDEESVSAGVALADGDGRRADETPDEERVAELEAQLQRKDRQLAAVVDQYERVLATRERLRRDAGEDDGPFVWTGQDR